MGKRKEYPEEVVALANLKDINSELRGIASVLYIDQFVMGGVTYQALMIENSDTELQIDRLSLISVDHEMWPLNKHLVNTAEVSAWGKYIRKTKLEYLVEEKGTTYMTTDLDSEGEAIDPLILYKKEGAYTKFKYNRFFKDNGITFELMEAIREDLDHIGEVRFQSLSPLDLNALINGQVVHIYMDEENTQYMILIDSILGISKTKTKDVAWRVLREDDIGYHVIVRTSSDILQTYHLLRFAKV